MTSETRTRLPKNSRRQFLADRALAAQPTIAPPVRAAKETKIVRGPEGDDGSAVSALLVLGAIAILAGVIARSLSDQVKAKGKDEIRREVASLIRGAQRTALHRQSASRKALSMSEAFVHGLGGLIDLFPEDDGDPDQLLSPQRLPQLFAKDRRASRVDERQRTG